MGVKERLSLKRAFCGIETIRCIGIEGGLFDQLGGGFHRYSTDRFWRVPHFEKMLYDNGFLAKLFLEMYQATKQDIYREV